MRPTIMPTCIAVGTLCVFSAGAQETDPAAALDAFQADPTKGVTTSASLGGDPIAIGLTLTATVKIELGEGISAMDSGIPEFILQLDPPKGLELAGERIAEYRQLARNEFLMEPWERLVKEPIIEVQFTLTEMPPKGVTLGLVVVGYVSSKPGKDDAFLRRRLELPLVVGADAREGDPLD